jgi:hypothetical protein
MAGIALRDAATYITKLPKAETSIATKPLSSIDATALTGPTQARVEATKVCQPKNASTTVAAAVNSISRYGRSRLAAETGGGWKPSS